MASMGKQGSVWPKWQIALAVGTPLAIGLAYWYLRSCKYSKNEKPKNKDSEKKKESNAIGAEGDQEGTVSQDPYEKAKSYKNKGNRFFKDGKYEKAIECYTEAIGICPPSKINDMATFYQNRAAASENLRNYDEVIEDCSRAIELNKTYIKALLRRAKAYEATNKHWESFEDLTAVCILENFQNMNTLQTTDRVLKTLSKAKAKELVNTQPKELPSKHFITNYFISFCDDPVLKEVLEYKKQEGKDPSKLRGYELVIHLLAEEQYEEVIPACTDEIERNGERLAEALLVRGTFNLLKCDMEATKSDLTRLVEMKEANVKLRVNALIKIGALKVQYEQMENALKDFDEAIKLDPSNADVYLHRGQIMLLTDNMEQTLSDMEKSVAANPDFPSARVQKCYVQYRNALNHHDEKKVQAVLEEFEQILEQMSTSTECLLLYAQVLCEREEYEKANELFKKVEELSPFDPNAYVHKGILVLQWKQDINEAISLLNKAIELDSKCQFAYETLGSIEVQRGNMSRGIELYQKAINLAHNEIELAHLVSLHDAAKAQLRVAERLNIPVSNGRMGS
ncbi:mitochondrial import receptor subunit TOM70 isoform X2 [Centruroides vittatus]|uniref:mitochondrial import receptor subunit TOM70 isoform X2 n=1 Tax=Centruroides vittatus TaxID=120091 RepID=UPI00350FD029